MAFKKQKKPMLQLAESDLYLLKENSTEKYWKSIKLSVTFITS